METKQVIVVRKDLKNMGWGKMAAQVAHASNAAAFTNYLVDNDLRLWSYGPPHEVKEWLRGAFTKICVWARNEDELLGIYDKARFHRLPCSLIQDNGKTVFKGVPTFTTVAVGPGEVSKVDKVTGNLRLI